MGSIPTGSIGDNTMIKFRPGMKVVTKKSNKRSLMSMWTGASGTIVRKGKVNPFHKT